MCSFSMVGDFYGQKWQPYVVPQPPSVINPAPVVVNVPPADYEQLKRDVADMKELLTRAKKYDEEHGEPECEKQEKIATLRAIAKLVGVDLSDLLTS